MREKKRSGQIARCALRFGSLCFSRYLLAGALSVGGLAERFMSWPAGAEAGGVAGRVGAAPVVMPRSELPRGVTSRMPGGAAGDVDGWVFCAVVDVPA
jgi:hypothetical protein